MIALWMAIAAALPLADARKAALAASPAGAAVEFSASLPGPVPLVVVSRRSALTVFVFPSDKPEPVRNHGLRRPGIGEDVRCGKLRLLPLGAADAAPVALAQWCNDQGDSEVRFLVFGDADPASPARGRATWSTSVYPDALHERFVPGDDPEGPGGISRRRGDGKTVIEAVEGREIRRGAFRVRDVVTVFSGGRLVTERGPWRRAEGE